MQAEEDKRLTLLEKESSRIKRPHATDGGGVDQHLVYEWIGEREPPQKKVNAQHNLKKEGLICPSWVRSCAGESLYNRLGIHGKLHRWPTGSSWISIL